MPSADQWIEAIRKKGDAIKRSLSRGTYTNHTMQPQIPYHDILSHWSNDFAHRGSGISRIALE
jgi:hypothetical protein